MTVLFFLSYTDARFFSSAWDRDIGGCIAKSVSYGSNLSLLV